MPACEIRVGFFTLEPCRQPSIALCSQCLRAACAAHLAPGTAGLCVECAAEGSVQPVGRGQDDSGDWADDLTDTAAFYRYRGGYYRRTGGYGSATDSSSPLWDTTDQAAFADGPSAPGDWDDADSGDASALDS